MLWLCFCLWFFLLLFFLSFQKKSQFLFCQTIDMTLSRSAACSYLQEIVFYLFYYSFLKFSNILPLYFLLSELGAGLGGGSRGRSHLQCDTEAGSDSAGGQQGSKMAWGECAHLMSPSVMKLTKLFQKRDKESNAPNAQANRSHIWKPDAFSTLWTCCGAKCEVLVFTQSGKVSPSGIYHV